MASLIHAAVAIQCFCGSEMVREVLLSVREFAILIEYPLRLSSNCLLFGLYDAWVDPDLLLLNDDIMTFCLLDSSLLEYQVGASTAGGSAISG